MLVLMLSVRTQILKFESLRNVGCYGLALHKLCMLTLARNIRQKHGRTECKGMTSMSKSVQVKLTGNWGEWKFTDQL